MGTGRLSPLLDYSGTWNGSVFTFNGSELADDSTFSFGANNYQISYNGMDGVTSALTLTTVAVPEPSTVAALIVGGLGLLIAKRRKRQLA